MWKSFNRSNLNLRSKLALTRPSLFSLSLFGSNNHSSMIQILQLFSLAGIVNFKYVWIWIYLYEIKCTLYNCFHFTIISISCKFLFESHLSSILFCNGNQNGRVRWINNKYIVLHGSFNLSLIKLEHFWDEMIKMKQKIPTVNTFMKFKEMNIREKKYNFNPWGVPEMQVCSWIEFLKVKSLLNIQFKFLFKLKYVIKNKDVFISCHCMLCWFVFQESVSQKT